MTFYRFVGIELLLQIQLPGESSPFSYPGLISDFSDLMIVLSYSAPRTSTAPYAFTLGTQH